MANIYILPTTDLLRLFRKYDNLFSFYEDGVKGVIRDIVLFSNAWELKSYSPLRNSRKPITAHVVFEKVIEEYHNTTEAIFNKRFGNEVDSECVELVAELMDNAVSEMMFVYFSTFTYNVSKTDWRWIGDDIVVQIKILNPK